MNTNLKSLIGKLNDTCRNALEAAAGLCMARANHHVEVEHLLLKLVENPDTDVARILRHFEVDGARLSKEITRALDRLKTGNSRTPAFGPQLPALIQEAWVLASVNYGAARVRSGHLLLALLADERTSWLAREISGEFARVSVEALKKNLVEIAAGSREDGEAPAARRARSTSTRLT